ncbi:MAG TPA: tetratricopeptide repeat protein [Pyrinomonadaceae bacterium]|nr:tetratricopeptide repeat protein [Pyrinomonadaceae bacterium]
MLHDRPARGPRIPLALLSLALLLTLAPAAAASAQAGADDKRQRAFRLFAEQKYLEALPLLEELAASSPKDAEVQMRLGFSLVSRSYTLTDASARQKERARARATLVRAKELGASHQLLDAMINAIPPDGGERGTKFSANEEANRAMREAESAFVKGETERAVAAYGRAFELDPKIYEAPLFAGDAYFKAKQFDKAGEWYARAVRLNPDRETAYRYWGNALLFSGKLEEARDKYVEAVIADPYNGYVWQHGLGRWANQARVRLAHPKIDVQQTVTPMKDNKMTITLDPKSLDKTDDGSPAWLMYGMKRAVWTTNDYERFRQEYPGEKTYRHSLREEADALRGVIEGVREQQKRGQVKQLSADLQTLLRLEEAGLLEAFVLLARADEGIARDYAEYRRANRDKLRRYLVEYVASGKY